MIGFSKKYPLVPVELFGNISHLAQPLRGDDSQQENLNVQPEQSTETNAWTEVRPRSHPRQSRSSPSHQVNQDKEKLQVRPKLKILLAKGPDGAWSPSVKPSGSRPLAPAQAATSGTGPSASAQAATSSINSHVSGSITAQSESQGVAGVVENVSSFLSGIRASFRQDSVYAGGHVHPNKQNFKK